MQIILKKGKVKLRLPVNPTDINISVSHQNTVVNIHALGDVNLIGKSGLKEISISSFFPANEYLFSYNDKLKAPMDYIHILEEWRESGEPILFAAGNLIHSTYTNKKISYCFFAIESLSYGQQDCTGDIYYTIALKEYKKIHLKGHNKKSNRSTKSSKEKSGKIYIVKSGDSLWKIAKRFYGNGALYKKIYEANRNVIKNENLIYVNQKLIIP